MQSAFVAENIPFLRFSATFVNSQKTWRKQKKMEDAVLPLKLSMFFDIKRFCLDFLLFILLYNKTIFVAAQNQNMLYSNYAENILLFVIFV